MISLKIPIEYHPTPGGRVDYYTNLVENAVLTLKTVPKMTYDENKNEKIMGRWISTSVFLGKEVSGDYYVTRISYFDDPDYVPITRDPRVRNPVGKFFDSTSKTSPFLILYNFAPNEMETVSAFGMLGERRDGVWSGVNWRNLSTVR